MKGSVRKRKDGRWEGRVELPKVDGKRKQKYVYADTRRECQRLVNELIHDIETGQFTDSGRLTVKGYMTNWFAVYRGKLAESTQNSHGNYVNKHIIPYFKEQRLKDLKPIDVDKFYNHERIVGIGGLDRDRNCAGDWQRRIFWLDTHYCIGFRDYHCRQCAQGSFTDFLFHCDREIFLRGGGW